MEQVSENQILLIKNFSCALGKKEPDDSELRKLSARAADRLIVELSALLRENKRGG